MDCSSGPFGTWQDSWRALEKLYAEGTVSAIGVSNFGPELMAELLDMATTTPHIVQVRPPPQLTS
jgi:diketogulonate reductase-like aldo/keto reductase